MVSERQVKRGETESWGGKSSRPTMGGGAGAARIIGLLLVVLLTGDAAFADFLIQPMLLRRTVQPGKTIRVEMMLQNMDQRKTETISLSLLELSQETDSTWKDMRPNDPNLSKYPIRSCRSWIVAPPDNIVVPPYKQQPFTMLINVPAGTRGFYFASLVAETAPEPATQPNGLVTLTKIAMVCPIILEVQSIPVQQKVSLTDAGLVFRPKTTEAPAASFLTVDIVNNGGTFSTIMPVVRLSGQTGGRSRKLLEANMGETAILPGAKLHLLYDVGRALGPGTYRVATLLYVDGRRADQLQKDIQFQGDPAVVGDPRQVVPLDLQPADTFLDVVPGATRSGVITVVNGSEESVKVETEFALPADMQSAQNARGVRGDDLSCTDWVTVEPRQFQMNAYGRTNLKVIARMPKGAAQYPCYYGTLKLRVSYRDGQPAGTKESAVCIQNKQVPAVPAVGPTVLTLSETGPSRYMVAAGYMNAGEMYVTPSCQGDLSVLGVNGITTYKRFLMSSETFGQKGILLPFQARSYSGVLDLSDVPAGTYYLTSILKWPGSIAEGLQDQRTITVTEQGGRKYARLTENAKPVAIKMQ